LKVKTNKVSHHPLNQQIYNLSAIEDLISSIEEKGLLQKLVINQSFQVISGNRRLAAIQKLGWKEVDVDQIKTDADEELDLLIHYNKQRVKTYREILNEIQYLYPKFAVGQGKRNDLTSVSRNKSSARSDLATHLGISESQIAKLMFIQKHDPSFIELIDQGQMTVSQSYQTLSRWKNQKEAVQSASVHPFPESKWFTFHRKSSHIMEEVSDASVDLVFTSPPYWNKRTYDNEIGVIGSEKLPKEFVLNLVEHLQDTKRVLKDTGSFFLVLGDTYLDKNLQNIPHRVSIALQDEGWILRNTIVWKKTNPKPVSSKDSLSPSYEFIFHFVKTQKYKFQTLLTPYVDGDLKGQGRVPRHRELDTEKLFRKIYPYVPGDGKQLQDYWDADVISTAVAKNSSFGEGVEHPAPFPEAIVHLPILMTTTKGDTVLDPFMGSGTTGRVANAHKRFFVGYDVKQYFASLDELDHG
jgi:DNA modification methylase